MKVSAVKTPLVRPGDVIEEIIAGSVKSLSEKSVLVIASKIFSFCENRLVEKKSGTPEEKYKIVRREADYWLPPQSSKYHLMLTIKGNWMFVNAGIDESNAANHYSLWPVNPQDSVNRLWQFLRRNFHLRHIGVIMSDSKSFPLNWGVVGHGIVHCGFQALKSYIGKPDLFGRKMRMEKVNLVQSLAAAGVLEMGEGKEQTPIAVITDIKTVVFQDRKPTHQELNSLKVHLKDDAYAPILLKANWKKGGR